MANKADEQSTISNSSSAVIDPKSGFCSTTKIFHSLRPKAPLPPQNTPLSVTHYFLSHLQHSPPPPSTPALLDAATGLRVLYPEFTRRVQSLAFSLQSHLGLSHGDCAFILSPNSLHVPVLYLSLFSLGVIVSPSNPASSIPELSRQIHICKPAVAFATSATAHKIHSLRLGTFLLDSAEFESMMTSPAPAEPRRVQVSQSDTATILYSSGTTGRVKGVALTHRNWISTLAASYAVRSAASASPQAAVALCTVPFFHSYGIAFCLRVLAMGDTLASISGRFDLVAMMRAIERFRITHVGWAPPVVVAMVKHGDGNETGGYDLSSLQVIACGGAPLAKSVIDKLKKRLPNIQVAQGYGLTETAARVFGAVGPEETRVEGANGKLMPNIEVKVVETDSETGIGLPP
ncbi:4-coumarate--CoA ligase-like 9 [Prunus yedoensis var. nudiflora]|uniref:4-coumarate--CoA ligase-like 9 n=1 Tax=Prunus yedoensis var. nudiflora TaxID=2094558 RepID=A0A314XL57_PRUYE|nr:4-coumarate--CoA ligase-like 9 [Prunus yedoensis var. nudiflora]